MKKRLFLGAALFGFASLSHAQDDLDAGPFYDVQKTASVGQWTVSSFRMEDKFAHAMMERNYDNGTLFRYFLGKDVTAFMIFDNRALDAVPHDGRAISGSYWFSGMKDGDTPPIKAAVSSTTTLTDEQDAILQIDLSENNDFLAALVEATTLNVKIGAYTGKFDLKGSQKAADELLKTANLADQTPQEEKIVIEPGVPAVVWDLSLPAGESKVYQIEGKRGQKMKLSFIEDTRKGQIDVGKASVEEGTENGVTIEFERNRLQRVDVSNPSKSEMEFRIYLSIE